MSTEHNSEQTKEQPKLRVVRASVDTQITDFGLDATSETMSVEEFLNKQDVFKFNDPIQRGSVWSIAKKSLLIVSVLQNVVIGQVMAQVIRKNGKKYRNVIDSKQRLVTLRDFVKSKIVLEKAPYIEGTDEQGEPILIDINGLTFEQLPEAFQRRIKAMTIEIVLFEVDDKKKAELFYRWNNGEPLKASEKRVSKMPPNVFEMISEYKHKSVITAALSDSYVNRNINSDMIQQAMSIIVTNNNTGLGATILDENLAKNAYNSQVIEDTKSAIDYLDSVYSQMDEHEQKEWFGKIRTVSLIYAAYNAIKSGMSEAEFLQRVRDFYNGPTAKNYATYCSSSTTKKDIVKRRNEILIQAIIG